ncbi:hypothetical protein [Pseudomonas aeruginosa]|uniref:hypothetical protein n=1 Tax=Pseudomonas aeruginosa TaxID=287 RepID=UPI001114D0A6|nr:hypothetical protein [Pseudomonas aeruginosa]MCT5519322.1 hypothetical protein [Pseudomonas aeruginosa]MEE2515677.1 hypothetical protein [Pseudomonas aeruginosa]HEJ1327457.1 hypothetical protein [Pseudomonas aeruginosa]
MFETYSSGAMAKPPFSSPEAMDWSYVVQSIDTPWFRLVCCRREDEREDWRTEVLFLGYVPLALAYLNANDPNFLVKEALIAMPAWLTGLRHCQFMPLQMIFSYSLGKGQNEQYGYEVEGGTRYPLNRNWSTAGMNVLYQAGNR